MAWSIRCKATLRGATGTAVLTGLLGCSLALESETETATDSAPLRYAEPTPATFSIGTTVRDQTLLEMARDPDLVETGRMVFQAYCSACHADPEGAEAGQPDNLFDAIWYHGATPAQIERTTEFGYPPTGMVGWKAVVPAEHLSASIAYVLAHQLELRERSSMP